MEKSSQSQTRRWLADAPSNIALIKYMGKTDTTGNRPTNTSFSYTLPHLLSYVELELQSLESGADRWEPLAELRGKGLEKIELSERGLGRFLGHLQNLKNHFGFSGSFVVRSANDFPSDCGLASSASSFAALTRAANSALSELMGREPMADADAAEWSRRGSGSSCRSFFAPWSVWSPEAVGSVEGIPYQDLFHQVVVVDEEIKSVSSSEAHKRVTSSLVFEGRPQRAEERVRALLGALRESRWDEAFEITWAEFWDMHALFETSRPSFGYMTAGSLEVLRFVRSNSWDKTGDGPLVTMDAGPNVHLLYKRDEASLAFAQEVERQFQSKFRVFSSEGSAGAKR